MRISRLKRYAALAFWIVKAGCEYAQAQEVRVDALTITRPGHFVGTVTSTPGSGLVVEVSTNLLDWEALGPLFNGAGQVEFVDAAAGDMEARYYRTRTLPLALPDIPAVPLVADLRKMSHMKSVDVLLVRGASTANDGGGGWFSWDEANTEADDGAVVVQPASSEGAGRWKRMEDGVINARWFGLAGDGVTDDSRGLQAALDLANRRGGARVYIPSGTYRIGGQGLIVGGSTFLYGAGGGSILKYSTYPGNAIGTYWDGKSGVGNVSIRELTIDCGGVGGNGVAADAAYDCTIHGLRIMNPKGYGIYVASRSDQSTGSPVPARRVTVANCHLVGVEDVGVELRGAIGCTVVGNTVAGSGVGQGFVAWDGASDCAFSGNVAEGTGGDHRFVGYTVQGLNPDHPLLGVRRTERIALHGNIARQVFTGVSIRGSSNSIPSDILARGNSFQGTLAANSSGVIVSRAERVTVAGNQVVSFAYPLNLNGDAVANGIRYVAVDNNVIQGGGTSRLYGNRGGSLSGNRFHDIADDAVILYGWIQCNISQNLFVSLGAGSLAYALIVQPDGETQASGNTFFGNMAMDDRATKYTAGAVLFRNGSPQDNLVQGNSALGSRAGAKGFQDNSSGTNNIVANNRDA